jgi:poly(3-hydroxybutyrate) depolymerase
LKRERFPSAFTLLAAIRVSICSALVRPARGENSRSDSKANQKVAATVPASGPDTTCVTHPGCKGGAEVTTCTTKGGGHVWFGDPSCGTGADACDIVGANTDYNVNNHFAWDLFKSVWRGR